LQKAWRCGVALYPKHELSVLERTAIESDSLVSGV
jgi:hypothetical protein